MKLKRPWQYGREPGLTVQGQEAVPLFTLRLAGALDQPGSRLLKQALSRILENPAVQTVHLDLADVRKVDGSGLAALVWAARQAATSARTLRLVNCPPTVRTLAQQLHLHQVVAMAAYQPEETPGEAPSLPPSRPARERRLSTVRPVRG